MTLDDPDWRRRSAARRLLAGAGVDFGARASHCKRPASVFPPPSFARVAKPGVASYRRAPQGLAAGEPVMKRAWGLALIAVMASAAVFAKPLKEERPNQAVAAAAKELPARPDLLAARSQRQAGLRQLDVSFKLDGAFHASGYTGCNSWSATAYPQQNQHLLVGGFASTKKACNKGDLDIERAFLRALQGTPAWDLVNGDLVIKGPGGAMRLVRSL